MTAKQQHWNEVYSTKAVDEVSWFQPRAEMSMLMIQDSGVNEDSAIIDIGGGSSVLIDQLLDADFSDVTVLDISERALIGSKERLGAHAAEVNWIVSDVLDWTPARSYDVWHDRAVFHFLTEERDRALYRATLLKGLRLGGMLIIGAFAENGPERCSGLPVKRWAAAPLAFELGPEFHLIESLRENHRTPAGAVQPFTWARFVRV
jgi:2-polyprenyl-3-methyl-5-hydroxy-6-metoxy-1,4-benzoquinol methylase